MPIVNSSNITGYGYNPNTRDLIVEFHGGRTYTYRAVPQDIADGLGSAESAGKYLNENIKGTFAVDRGGSLWHEPHSEST